MELLRLTVVQKSRRRFDGFSGYGLSWEMSGRVFWENGN